jgi:ribosome-binding protein aMBF1 (putative translation factor)
MKANEIKTKFDDLLCFKSAEEELEHNAQMLAFNFLSIIDAEMEKQNISKKQLAAMIETSPSFITQVFRGDKKPNWTTLARMQKELNIDFKVTTENAIEERISNAISDAHKKWVKEGCYTINDSRKLIGFFEVSTGDYAFAS